MGSVNSRPASLQGGGGGPAPIIIPVTSVGEYTLVKTLGKGAFGEVHLVKDRAGKEFALKQIMCNDRNAVEMAVREIETLKKLKHPAIVKLEKGTYHEYRGHRAVCIVMEFVKGTNLEDFLSNSREKLDTSLVMKWFLTMLEALEYIHANGIGHRDLKPANILIDEEGNLKIADFGISQTVSQSNAFKTVAGTLTYMAPEMLKNEKYDTRVDVWSLGCILYEVFTGATLREIMALKLATNPNLIESTVDNKAVQQLLCLMLTLKDNRLTSKQLLEHDIIKGWKDLLTDKDTAPKSTHYLLPFVSCLGPGSPILRLAAIKYLQNWSKISAVHKAINAFGIDGLTASLTIPETSVADKLNNQLIIAMMTSLCNRVHVGPASSRTLYSSGAFPKLMQLLRVIDNPDFAAAIAQLVSLIVRYPQLCYVMDREEAVYDWVAAAFQEGPGSKMFSAAENIYVDLPFFSNENWAWPIWISSMKNDQIGARLLRLIQHRQEPHLLVTPSTRAGFQTLVATLEREPLDKDRAEALLRLVRSYDRPIAQAYLKGQCTFGVTGEVFLPQIFFHCKTCWPKERANGCCLSCAYTCHKGHNLKYRPPNNAYCDCGPSAKCQAQGQNDSTAMATFELIPTSAITMPINTNMELLTWRHADYSEGRMLQATSLYQPFGFDLNGYTGNRNSTAFYFEAEIVECPKSIIAIGIAPLHTDHKATPKLPGYAPTSWGYHSDDGKLFIGGRSGGNVFGPTYSVGDIIGCGVTGTGKVFFTLNGLFIGAISEATAEPGTKLFATVARLGKTPMLVRVRVKPPFKFTTLYDDLPREPLSPGSIKLNKLALDLLFGGAKMADSVLVKKYFNSNLPNDLVAHFAHILHIHDSASAERITADLGSSLRRSGSQLAQRLQKTETEKPLALPPGGGGDGVNAGADKKVPGADYASVPRPQINMGSFRQPTSSITTSWVSDDNSQRTRSNTNSIDPSVQNATLPAAGQLDQPAMMAMMHQFLTSMGQNPQTAAGMLPSTTTTTTALPTGMLVAAPAALLVRVALNEKTVYELNIVVRTMNALIAEFWEALSNDYSPSKYTIAKIERVAGASRIEIKQDRSVERLKDDDELIFHLSTK